MLSSRRPARIGPADQPLPFGTDADPEPKPVLLLAGGAASVPDAETAIQQAQADSEPSSAGGRKTHCPAGHAYDDANTYVDRHGWRSCRACKRISDRLRRERTAKRLTPEQRIMRSRLAAYQLHATHDPKVTTRKAREAFAGRFERQVDPDGVLSPAERAQRAEAARRAYFIGLALRSSQARRRKTVTCRAE